MFHASSRATPDKSHLDFIMAMVKLLIEKDCPRPGPRVLSSRLVESVGAPRLSHVKPPLKRDLKYWTIILLVHEIRGKQILWFASARTWYNDGGMPYAAICRVGGLVQHGATRRWASTPAIERDTTRYDSHLPFANPDPQDHAGATAPPCLETWLDLLYGTRIFILGVYQ